MSDKYTNPLIWGPHFWFVFRCIANNYPEVPNENDKKGARSFYEQFKTLLPCETCRQSFSVHLDKFPIDSYLINKNKLIEWVDLIYKETKKNINTNVDNNINANNKQQTKMTQTRVCNTCGSRNKGIQNENLFPKADANNSGINKGYVGGLRKALSIVSSKDKYVIISFYNWIKSAVIIPTQNEAISILKGYNLVRTSNEPNFFPSSILVNNINYDLTSNDPTILTNHLTNQQIHKKLRELSI